MLRDSEFGAQKRLRVHLCFGPNCTPRGSQALMPLLLAAIERAGIADEVEVIATSCRDRCEFGPSMNVYPGPVFYAGVTPEAIEQIVREHFVGGRPVERFRFRDPSTARQPMRGAPKRWSPNR